MNRIHTLVAVGVTFGCVAGAANAAPILPGPETPLVDLLNSVVTGGPAITVADQDILSGVFTLSALNGFSTIVFEVAGNAGTNTFGIYDPTDPTKYVQLFAGANTPLNDLSLTFVSAVGGFHAKVDGVESAVTFSTVNFGFYLGSGGAPVFFSQPALNQPGATDQFAYFGGNGTQTFTGALGGFINPFQTTDFFVAVEDIKVGAGSDQDYNDFVTLVRNINPVPEPATVALLGTGLIGLGAMLRRRRNS